MRLTPFLALSIHASVCFGQINNNNNNMSFATVPSSQLTMLLRPTFQQLNLVAISTIQESIRATLLLASQNSTSLSIANIGSFHVITQEVEWLIGTHTNSTVPGYHLSSTRFQFAVLVTLMAAFHYPTLTELDYFITSTFASPYFESKFEHLLMEANNTRLQDVESVEVVLSPQPPTESSSVNNDTRLVSKMDIILIVLSGSILLGVLYMICRHHLDHGYIETQRMRILSRQEDGSSYRTATTPFGVCHSSAAVQFIDDDQQQQHRHTIKSPEEDIVVVTPSAEDHKVPSTPSTIVDIMEDSPERPDRPPTPVNTPSPDAISHKLLPSSRDAELDPTSSTNRSMPEVFTSNWFRSHQHQQKQSHQQQQQRSLLGVPAPDSSSSSSNSSSSSSSNSNSSSEENDVCRDLFQATTSTQLLSSSPSSIKSQGYPPHQPRLSSYSSSSSHKKTTLSEWMKGIRVVSSDRTSETTLNSLERTSTVEPPSVGISLTSSSSLNTPTSTTTRNNNNINEPMSLEHSMARSTVVLEQVEI